MTGTFRKKPVEVQAVACADALRDASKYWWQLPEWLADAYERGQIVFGDKQVHIKTLEGNMTADYYDWIIQGVAGEIYPCKPEIFRQTYDHVGDA